MDEIKPTTWNEAAQTASSYLYSVVRDRPTISVGMIQSSHTKFIDSHFTYPSGPVMIAKWIDIGASALELAAKNDLSISQKTLVRTLCRKQHDYGVHNILRFGQQGLLIRVWDKISRLENLERKSKDPQVANESQIDTMLDIAGYATIGIMLERGWFRLPLQG
jgi:hypothetical protein